MLFMPSSRIVLRTSWTSAINCSKRGNCAQLPRFFTLRKAMLMNKWFPEMYDRPENGSIAVSAIYWVICYFMIPFVTRFLSYAFSSDLFAVIGVDIATYIVNFLCIFWLFRAYLSDSYLNIQKGFAVTVLISTGLVLLIEISLMYAGIRLDWMESLSAYPISETSVVATASVVVGANPLLGTLCMTFLTPITVSCMFYGTIFAPIANTRPLLAYAATAVLMVLPRLLSTWWLGVGNYDVAIYLLQLPVHMIACWSYQRTNTIWAPIITLSISNLLTSLLFIFLIMIGFLFMQ